MENVNIQVIARMKSDFPTKFGIPRQSGLVETLRSTIIFEPEFRNPDALRGIEGYSHLWLKEPNGLPPFGLPVWAEMFAWVYLPPALPSAPILWVFPV